MEMKWKADVAACIAMVIWLLPSVSGGSMSIPPAESPDKISLHKETKFKGSITHMNIPLFFIENQGQLPAKVRYYVKSKGHEIFFAEDGVYFSLLSSHGEAQKHENLQRRIRKVPAEQKRYRNFKLTFLGANPHPQIMGEDKKTGKVHYFKGKDPYNWKTNIPTYGAVVYKNVYKGIDIKFYGVNKNLEYDVVVHPGADIGKMRFSYNGVGGLELTQSGDLLINTQEGNLIHKKPRVYQEIDGKNIEREGSFELINKNTYTFNVKDYDQTYALILDPVLLFSAYLGGGDEDTASAIALDRDGNIYITGETSSSDFPTEGAYQTAYGGKGDAFVVKLAGDGSSLIFSTFLGGNDWETATAIQVDDIGNIYVAGETESSNFPTVNSLQGSLNGGSDVFVAELSGDGSTLILSTYLGGSSYEGANGLGIDSFHNICLAGYTMSRDFPTENPFQEEYGGGNFDGFVTKLSSNGSSLIFSTFLGGTYIDYINDLALDSENNNIVVTGYTDSSTDFPIYRAEQGSYGGYVDAFVSKFHPDGSSLAFSTFLGGGSTDEGRALALDRKGNIYVTGSTRSSNFPTQNPLQQNHGGGQYDAFVTEISAHGSSLLFSTYLGGGTGNPGVHAWDKALSVAVDEKENIYIAGFTYSADFPLENAFQKNSGGSSDAFISMISSDHSRLIFSSYLGGSGADSAGTLALNGAGDIYVAGLTYGFQGRPTAGGSDAFVVNIYEPVILTGDKKPSIPPTSETKRYYNYHGTNPCQSVEGSPGPVFVESGDFYYQATDIFIRARGIPINITRYYNTQDLYDGPFGHGWNMDYTTQLVQTEEDGVTYATVRMGSGLRIKFTDNGDGTYTPPLGSTDILVKNGDDSFTLNGNCTSCSRKPLPAYHFRSDGTLDHIEDMNGNTVSIGYNVDGRIETVTDANGRVITFSYGTNGRVETISDFSTPVRTWQYAYDENDNLISVTDPSTNIIQYEYDDQHNLTAIIDARENRVSAITYDDNDKVTSFADKGGTYQIDYDPVNKVTRKVDPNQKVFSFNYDDYGNVTNKLNPKGDQLNLTWDSHINVTGKENSRGIKTSYTYDDRGNILTMTKDSGDAGLQLTTAYEYDTRFDKVTKIIPPLGATHQTTFVYDANGNLESKSTPAGTTHYEYDTNGNLIRITDPDGYVKAMEYDPNGYLIRVYIPGTNPIIETIYTHDERGNILTKTDPNGNTTTYHYDVLDRLDWVEDATPNHNRTIFEYDANGNLTLIRDPNLNETKFEYDEYNQLIKRIDGYASATLRRETTYAYDNKGNLKTVTDPLNHITTYGYDELNRLVSVKDHLNHEWVFTYDENGNLLTKTDPNLNTTTYTYDPVNRLKTVTDAENHTTTYNYDKNGNLESIIDANTHPAAVNTYNANDLLATTTDPVQPVPASFTYYPSGRIYTMTDANGMTTTYVYEALTGRLKQIQYQGGRIETFTYDRAGNVLSISDNQTNTSVAYTYDELNRIKTETQLGQAITYNYDDRGLRSSMVIPGIGTFTYHFDELNRLDYLVDNLNETTTFEYYANDLPRKRTYYNGSYTEYDYDEVNRLTSVTHKKQDGTIIASFEYTYDNMNNRITANENGTTITYAYDKTYKLISAAYPSETISYTYDPVGNRITMTDKEGTNNYFYDDANRLTYYTQPSTPQTNYSYDDNGNVITKQISSSTITYAYDEKNRLTKVSLDHLNYDSFVYDPIGRMVKKVNVEMGGPTTSRFLHDGQNIVGDIIGEDEIPVFAATYTPALGIDDLISMHQGTNTYYYLRNGLNSVQYLLKPDETIAESYHYRNPYGSFNNQTGSTSNTFTFTGRRVATESGLMYYRSRYYDPMIGRFLRKDNYKGTLMDPLSLHRYAYVKNNPVNYMDPMGEQCRNTGMVGWYEDIACGRDQSLNKLGAGIDKIRKANFGGEDVNLSEALDERGANFASWAEEASKSSWENTIETAPKLINWGLLFKAPGITHYPANADKIAMETGVPIDLTAQQHALATKIISKIYEKLFSVGLVQIKRKSNNETENVCQ